MSEDFYIEDSDDFYFGKFWEGNRVALQKEKAKILSRNEANKLKVDDFFKKSDEDEKPILNDGYSFFAFPYELDDDVYFRECRLIDSIICLINKNLLNEKYFASTDSDKCCVIQFSTFNEAILWGSASGHLNTPYVIFDKEKKFFMLLDYDFPLQIVGYKEGCLSPQEVEQWKYFFQKEWVTVLQKYKNYRNLTNIMKKYYPFIVTETASTKPTD